MSEKVTPSAKAMQAIADIESRLIAQHKKDLEAKGLTNAIPPASYVQKPLSPEEQAVADEAAKPQTFSIVGKESFESLNMGHQKITAPSRVRGQGGELVDITPQAVRGPSKASVDRGEERQRELARQELERLQAAQEAKDAFTPTVLKSELDALRGEIEYLKRQLKKVSKANG